MPSGAPGAMLGQGAVPGMAAKSQEEQLWAAEVLFQPARHRGHFCAPAMTTQRPLGRRGGEGSPASILRTVTLIGP